MSEKVKHKCEGDNPVPNSYGLAITYCEEDEKGRFIVSNEEYGSYVDWCPYCGLKAPVSRYASD